MTIEETIWDVMLAGVFFTIMAVGLVHCASSDRPDTESAEDMQMRARIAHQRERVAELEAQMIEMETQGVFVSPLAEPGGVIIPAPTDAPLQSASRSAFSASVCARMADTPPSNWAALDQRIASVSDGQVWLVGRNDPIETWRFMSVVCSLGNQEGF